MRLPRFAVVVFVASCLVPGSMAAQPATPGTAIDTCAVPHREISAIVAGLSPPRATPAATPGHSHDAGAPAPEEHAHAEATSTPFEPVGTPRLLQPELPAGAPVSAGITAGLSETMEQYLACANAGDVLGLMSLVSDEFLRHSFGAGILTEAELRAYAAAGQAVPPERQRRLVAIRQARQLSDGRVAALVDSVPVPSTNPAAIDTDLVTFTDAGGRYLIDRYVAGVTIWFGPNATPMP